MQRSSGVMVLLLPLPGIKPAAFTPADSPALPGGYINAAALESLEEWRETAPLSSLADFRGNQLVVDILSLAVGSFLVFFPSSDEIQLPPAPENYSSIALMSTPVKRFRCCTGSLTSFADLPIMPAADAWLLHHLLGGNTQPRALWLSPQGALLAAVEGHYVTPGLLRKIVARKH